MNEYISTQDFCYKEAEIPLYVTLYKNKIVDSKAALLYFHGGGLLCGNRHDLPELHIQTLCDAGYPIFAFDYRLAPATKIPEIMDDVLDGIRWFLNERKDMDLPYFLWGRSSGAYLSLLAGREICLENDSFQNYGFSEAPRGILSYYGYTFLENHWYNTPNDYYVSVTKVNPMVLNHLRDVVCADVSLERRFALYMCARQQGKWITEFFDDREKYFYAPYSFRLVESFQGFPPTFITHASGDPDVPFAEAQDLVTKLPDTTVYYVSKRQHDYDRDVEDPATVTLLEKTMKFLDELSC